MDKDIKWKEFGWDSAPEIEAAIKGKSIAGIELLEAGGWQDDAIVFKFTDGTELHFTYDWIYDWGVKEGNPNG